MSSLLTRSSVKKYILDRVTCRRPALGITRVSSESIDKLEAELKVIIDKQIDSHPTIGKTFKP